MATPKQLHELDAIRRLAEEILTIGNASHAVDATLIAADRFRQEQRRQEAAFAAGPASDGVNGKHNRNTRRSLNRAAAPTASAALSSSQARASSAEGLDSDDDESSVVAPRRRRTKRIRNNSSNNNNNDNDGEWLPSHVRDDGHDEDNAGNGDEGEGNQDDAEEEEQDDTWSTDDQEKDEDEESDEHVNDDDNVMDNEEEHALEVSREAYNALLRQRRAALKAFHEDLRKSQLPLPKDLFQAFKFRAARKWYGLFDHGLQWLAVTCNLALPRLTNYWLLGATEDLLALQKKLPVDLVRGKSAGGAAMKRQVFVLLYFQDTYAEPLKRETAQIGPYTVAWLLLHSHANALVVNHDTKTYFVFEPHGVPIPDVVEKLEAAYAPLGFRLDPMSSEFRHGPQNKELDSNFHRYLHFMTNQGNCLLWSAMFQHLMLTGRVTPTQANRYLNGFASKDSTAMLLMTYQTTVVERLRLTSRVVRDKSPPIQESELRPEEVGILNVRRRVLGKESIGLTVVDVNLMSKPDVKHFGIYALLTHPHITVANALQFAVQGGSAHTRQLIQLWLDHREDVSHLHKVQVALKSGVPLSAVASQTMQVVDLCEGKNRLTLFVYDPSESPERSLQATRETYQPPKSKKVPQQPRILWTFLPQELRGRDEDGYRVPEAKITTLKSVEMLFATGLAAAPGRVGNGSSKKKTKRSKTAAASTNIVQAMWAAQAAARAKDSSASASAAAASAASPGLIFPCRKLTIRVIEHAWQEDESDEFVTLTFHNLDTWPSNEDLWNEYVVQNTLTVSREEGALRAEVEAKGQLYDRRGLEHRHNFVLGQTAHLLRRFVVRLKASR